MPGYSDLVTRRISHGAPPVEPQAGAERRATSRLKALGVGAVAVLTLTACQWTSTVQTDRLYEPADGSSVAIGDLKLTNLLVVARAKGGPGTVAGLVTNGSAQPAQVTVGSKNLTVPPGAALQLDGAQVTNVAAPPGANLTLPVQSSAGSTLVSVPVLAPIYEYASLAPTPAASSAPATPAASPTGASTGSAEPAPGAATSGASESAPAAPTQTSTTEPQATPAPGGSESSATPAPTP